MLVTAEQFSQIMHAVVEHASYRRIYDVAERYLKEKLAEQYQLSVETGVWQGCQDPHCITSELFIGAWRDFLSRDSAAEASQCRKNAEALEAAVRVASTEDGRLLFWAVMGVHLKGQVRIRSSADNDALHWLARLAEQEYERASQLDRDRKNITYFYCLGRRWRLSGMPLLPSAGQAASVYEILVEAIRNIAPECLADIKERYDAADDGSEIRRLMRAGYNSAAGLTPVTSDE